MGKKIGFIGCGNMGSAMIKGMLQAGTCARENLMASTRREESAAECRAAFGIEAGNDNIAVARFADILFLAVKPQFFGEVIPEIAPFVHGTVVSLAPGWTLAQLRDAFRTQNGIMRMMPNTPVSVGAGMIGYCTDRLSDEESEEICRLFADFCKLERVSEQLMDVVTATSGSSPAYVFMFIEAIADAAVAGGMPRKQAYRFASQAVLGAAKMVLDTGLHPGELKDMVTSPGGTAIQAVRVLEAKGLRSTVFEAMTACIEKSRKL